MSTGTRRHRKAPPKILDTATQAAVDRCRAAARAIPPFRKDVHERIKRTIEFMTRFGYDREREPTIQQYESIAFTYGVAGPDVPQSETWDDEDESE